MEYAGPLRDEPLAVELHNTLYAEGHVLSDGLANRASADAWLDAVAERLPRAGSGRPPALSELVALRTAIRAALHAALDGAPQDPSALAAINRASAGAPRSPVVNGALAAGTDYHGATRAQIVLAALAWDAIDLLTGPRLGDLRSCGAPGCVLLFVKDHPRREWCSNGCGNRARQARHYERVKAAARGLGLG